MAKRSRPRARVTSTPSTRIRPSVGSSRRTMVRPSVDLPQPDSPTRPSVRPASTRKPTPSTARTWPIVRRSRGERTGKYVLRSCTSSSARHTRLGLRLVRLDRKEAAGAMAGRERIERRHGIGATRSRARAAVAKAAAGRPLERRGDRALDRDQPVLPAVQARDRAQQRIGVGMPRRAEQLEHVRGLDDAAGIHHRDPVGDLGDHAEIVGDHHDRHAELALERQKQVEDLRLGRDVERRGGLVGDQKLGPAHQRHRDHHALAHAAGQLVRIGVRAIARAPGCRPCPAWPRPRARPRRGRAGGARAAPRPAGRRPDRPGSARSSAPERSCRGGRRACAASARSRAPRDRCRRTRRGPR